MTEAYGPADALAQLTAAAVDTGDQPISAVDMTRIATLIDQASEAGAARALHRLGLSDDTAENDLRELRQLLQAWRDAKHSAWKAAIDWCVRGTLALLLIGLAMKFGFGAWVK